MSAVRVPSRHHRFRTLLAASVAALLLLAACGDGDVRTYEVYLSVGNLLGRTGDGDDVEPAISFVSTLRQSTDGEDGWFGYRERTADGWRTLLDIRGIRRVWPGIGTVYFGELRANDAGAYGFCGYPSLVARNLDGDWVLADLTALWATTFAYVEPLAGSRFVYLGDRGLLVDWDDGWTLRATALDERLVSAWTDDEQRLLVASETGIVLREEGDGWVETLRWTGPELGPSVAAPGGGRYFNGGVDGLLTYDGARFAVLHAVPLAPWWRPRPLGPDHLAAITADGSTVIGFDGASWWVEAEFPGREVNGLWSPDGERLLVAVITPDDRWYRRRAALHERVDGVWSERDLHAMYGTAPASGGAKAWSLVAPPASTGEP